jgi:lysophospholipase L1-like esterase
MTVVRGGSKLAQHIIFALAVIFALVALFAVYRAIWSARGDPDIVEVYRFRRTVQTQLNQTGPAYAAIIGDSIAAKAPHRSAAERLCGRPLVTAALDGAQLRHALDDILPLLQDRRPDQIVIAIGVNETKRLITKPRRGRLAEFTQLYRRLLVDAQALTPAVAVLLIAPVAKDGPMGDQVFDGTLIAEFNKIISGLAAEANVPTFSLAAFADTDGFARRGLTVDGVHPTSAGYAVWMDAADQAWTSVTRCN